MLHFPFRIKRFWKVRKCWSDFNVFLLPLYYNFLRKWIFLAYHEFQSTWFCDKTTKISIREYDKFCSYRISIKGGGTHEVHCLLLTRSLNCNVWKERKTWIVLKVIGCLGALKLNERLLNTYWMILFGLLVSLTILDCVRQPITIFIIELKLF